MFVMCAWIVKGLFSAMMTEYIEFQNDFEGIVCNCMEVFSFLENIEIESILQL